MEYVLVRIVRAHTTPLQLVLRAKREGEDLQQVRLKSFGHGGRGQNFVDTTFSDDAAEHFPIWQVSKSAATYRPSCLQ